jgi:predicted transcriptional regulator
MNIMMDNQMANRATVTFHTTPEIKERLDRLATVTRRSKSFLTNAAVEQYLAAEEDFVSRIARGIDDAEGGRSYSTQEAMVSMTDRINARAAAKS